MDGVETYAPVGGGDVYTNVANTLTSPNTFTDAANANAKYLIFNRSNGEIGSIQGTNSTQILTVQAAWSGLTLKTIAGGNITFSDVNVNLGFINTNGFGVVSAKYLGWDAHTRFKSPANGTIVCHDSTDAAGCQMEFFQKTDIANPQTNCAAIGAEDVSGTAELIGVDEAGNETQLTSHRSDGPEWLYDDTRETGNIDLIDYHCNRYSGVVEWNNVSRERRLARKGIAQTEAEGLPTTCHWIETLEDYCDRTGKVKPRRDWQADQDAKQAAYNTLRAQETDEKRVAEEQYAERVAKNDSDHIASLDAYARLPAEEKATKPAPVKLEVPPLPEVAIRPAVDIRKDPPAWMVSLDIAQLIDRKGVK